ncbi:GNAT family N-acetyltransferase [Chitinophaga rhizophila]|uniref:GNAT family N-acetyltransferase n=1 Tax=Chitinophaga rhizophila TaxID=2866212 RepID=A0ABS7G7H3_9BACT|nr:GNAT family N-acetyltransferase [Chitinophaga rhizophila]MBW8683599.1 GNAT family N-acetyltransferase [Chitinophaga rhizophila]
MNEVFDMLDNPVWHALQTTHQAFAQGNARIQRYPAGTLQFTGCADPLTTDLNQILPWTVKNERLILIGDLPQLPPEWSLVRQLDCIQMVCHQPETVPVTAAITRLTSADVPDMLSLTSLVQPGFFYKNTPLLGTYYGIRQEGQLVAMAGERICMTGLTEVSGVCTHPSYTGRGYAQQLVSKIVNENMSQGLIPYLHFVHTNERAGKIYDLLGFRERRAIVFWEIIRVG